MCIADQGMDRHFEEKGAKRVNFLSVKTPLVKEKHRCLLLVILGRRRGVLSGAEVPIDLKDSRSSFLASMVLQPSPSLNLSFPFGNPPHFARTSPSCLLSRVFSDIYRKVMS